jgi:hypothetical protein
MLDFPLPLDPGVDRFVLLSRYNDMAKKDKERYESEKAELYSDFRGSASGSVDAFAGGSKRKHSRWSDEEVAHLKSVSVWQAVWQHPRCCHLAKSRLPSAELTKLN